MEQRSDRVRSGNFGFGSKIPKMPGPSPVIPDPVTRAKTYLSAQFQNAHAGNFLKPPPPGPIFDVGVLAFGNTILQDLAPPATSKAKKSG
uniref:Uncharacterized protein n=1 Tax=Romanomermis culicivorax TaxID=13658 RepID=A0A915IH11_ROMCU